jgi:amidophosphoribosyltransferase
MARFAGANKVTFTSAAPPVRFPHVYGINMPTRYELIAHDRTVSEIEEKLSIDQMIYQEIEDLKISITTKSFVSELDLSCFTGEYVTGTITEEYLDWVENEYLS